MSRRPTPADTCARWHVDLRTAQRWHAGRGKHHPSPAALAAGPAGQAAMLAWVASLPGAIQSKLSPRFRAEITRLRIAIERGESPHPTPPPSAGSAGASHPAGAAAPRPPPPRHAAADDPDYATFLAERTARAAAPSAQDTTALAELKLQRDYALYQIRLANQRRDLALLKDATDTFHRLSSAVYDEEMLAARLGREVGDILPRPEAERLIRALLYWLLRSADALQADLEKPLAEASSSGPLFREEVRQILEPALLATRVVAPFARAAQLNAGHTLPAWAIAAFREALAASIEDGAALFDTLYRSPVPPPPASGSIPSIPSTPSISGEQVTEAPSGPPPGAIAAPQSSVPLVSSVPVSENSAAPLSQPTLSPGQFPTKPL